jgi:tetratricopeptide (TPR) repeat protein
MSPASFLKRVAIACALAVIAIAVYAPATGFGFINLDDPGYVTNNAHVLEGVTTEGTVWAFTTTSQANWHPLTWLSLQLDAQRGGSSPRPFHATNVALHVLNVLLLFLLFDRLTASPWKSGLVAALFALHPCHVESVAWVAERKDVLSTAFGLAAFHAWLSYVRRPGPLRLGLAASAHAASLLAKPMFVSFPVLLFLFDVWPLARRESRRRLVAEKIPFIAFSVASCVLTLVAQSHGGATRSLVQSPFTTRALNALVSYLGYLGEAIWPSGLAVYYPFPYDGVPAWKAMGAASLLALITWACLRLRVRAPYLLVGWLWYVVTLAPVIGLVQVGAQAMADRYTYVPLIGPFVMLAWGLGELDRRIEHRGGRVAELALVLAGVSALGISARRQVETWKDSLTLFERAVSVTTGNAVAHYGLAAALFERGEMERGVAECREAVRIAPGMPDAESSLVRGLLALGRLDEAAARAREGLASRPADSRSDVNAGVVALMERRYDAAELHFREALRLDPEDEDAHLNLASVLFSRGRRDEAITHFEEAVRLRPMDAKAVRALARARAAR